MSVVRTLQDLYPRLVADLSMSSAGRSNDNAAGYAPAPDPRKAPLRVEVSDLLTEVEDTCKRLAGHVCAVLEREPWEPGRVTRREGVDSATVAALVTLRDLYPELWARFPAMAAAAEDRLRLLVLRADRALGEGAPPPVPLESRCPACGQPSIFRVEHPSRGVLAVCSNPADPAPGGGRRQWSEHEWEDAHAA